MRVVQVANFYGPRSGGLRTAVDRLGAEYCAAGPRGVSDRSRSTRRAQPTAHRRRANHFARQVDSVHRRLPRGDAGPSRALLEALRPDTLEVSDRLTLRSLGRWGREHGATTVMISHERLDRLAGQVLPRRPAQSFADFANARTAAELRHRGVHHRVCARRIRPHRRDEHRHRPTGRGPADLPPAPTLLPGAPTLGRTDADPAGALRPAVGGKAGRPQHRRAGRVVRLPASRPDWSSWARARCGPGCSDRPPGCRSTSPVSSPIGTPSPGCWPRPMSRWHRDRTKRSGWPRWSRWRAEHRPWCRGRRR